MYDLNNLWKYELCSGNSDAPRNGACLMDAVSWLEYGRLGDHPECVCPVIATFGRGINDAMSNKGRQRLRVFIPRLVGTVDPKNEKARGEYLAWQAIRVFAPLALNVAGLKNEASVLRNFSGGLDTANAAARAAADAAARAASAAASAAHAAASTAARAASAAAYAANAAARAASAARAAAYAANAAAGAAASAAASTAANAAHAAASAAADAAADAATEDAMVNALDGVLKIGKQAEPIIPIKFNLAVEKFELARCR